jgi:hypothetical protein
VTQPALSAFIWSVADLLRGVAGEMGTMCDGLVERLVSSEFSASPV